ncbi:hypothetical protein Ae201684P_007992 [Aphanomyces euteiches]|uniref:histone deacetylase n=1 Tax=Aphanomyces euteiches TaxID=100861 RepID=A0A6G0WM31_9STRA|nr:hypothetical protein Ae201684_013747 [Aphanomyces euteiches]KAH9080906.1 hypothetical protein Ae201684P_007992 [Aphanomyces euteiches]
MTSDRLRPIMTTSLTVPGSSSRNNTPRDIPTAIPALKRRVSFTNHGDPDQPIPDKLEDLLEADNVRERPKQQMPPVPRTQETQLQQACQAFDVNRVLSLLQQPPTIESINAVSYDGYTSLFLACTARDDQFAASRVIVEELLRRGASIDIPDGTGCTVLHLSATFGNAGVLGLLLHDPLRVDVVCRSDGETPLHRACRFGHLHCIRLLLEHGASLQATSHALVTPVDVAGLSSTDRDGVFACLAAVQPSIKTLVLHHPDCHDHVTTATHQESPQRIDGILGRLRPFHLLLDVSSDFPFATLAAVRRVHSAKYIDTLKSLHHHVQTNANGVIVLTPRIQVAVQGTALDQAKQDAICDTNFSRGTLKAALRAAGSVCHAIQSVVLGRHRNAFCVVRPPGHHAGWSGLLKDAVSCGFCILNNIMIGAQYALDTFPHVVKKVAIVDFDAHHGNGTQDILEHLPRHNHILFVSLHLYADGFYPGSGHSHDLARNIYNFPLPPVWSASAKEKGSTAFRSRITSVVLPLLAAFQPDLILVSAGFDGCHHDIGNKQHGQRDGAIGLDLTPGDFYWATTQLKQLANVCCQGRLVSVLEGGYGRRNEQGDGLDLDVLQESAAAHVQALTGQTLSWVAPPPTPPRTSGRAVKRRRKELD